LSEDEREAVKTGARDLLDTLKNEKLVIGWREKQKARSAVRRAIEKGLDEHVYATYHGPADSFYERAA
jgi:type I restriction enzyme R subunit